MKDIFSDIEIRRFISDLSNGDFDKADALIEKGIDINARGKHGINSVWWMVWCSNVDGLKFLLSRGARADFVSETHGSPLALACLRGEVEIVYVLLEAGADVNAIHHVDRTTPIFDAILALNLEIAKILLDHGASLTVKDEFGRDPIEIATIVGRFDFVYVFLLSGNAPVEDSAWLARVEQRARERRIPEDNKLHEWKLRVLALIENLRDVPPDSDSEFPPD